MFVRRSVALGIATVLALGTVTALPSAVSAAEILPAPESLTATVENGDVVLSWERVASASAYKVVITNGSESRSVNTYAPRYVLPDAVTDGDLTWTVAAYSSGTSNPGETSAAQTIDRTIAKPAGLEPGGSVTEVEYPTPVTFSWTAVPGAARYRVEWSSDGFGTVTGWANSTTTSHTPATPLARVDANGLPIVWQWRVRAELYRASTSTFVIGSFSTPKSFETTWPDAPQLQSPGNVLTERHSDLKFEWTPVPGAMNYYVELAKFHVNGELSTILESEVVYGTTWVPTTVLSTQPYFWRVTPRDAAGRDGTPSAVEQFYAAWDRTTNASVPEEEFDFAAPVRDQGTADPDNPEEIAADEFELSWDPLPRAAYYTVTLEEVGAAKTLTCTTASTSVTVVSKTTISQADFYKAATPITSTCLKDLKTGTTYGWTVSATNHGAADSSSMTQYYENKLYVRAVADGGSSTPRPWADEQAKGGQSAPVFDWEPFGAGAPYTVTVTLSEYGTVAATWETNATRLRPTGVFSDVNTTPSYYWKVADKNGQSSGWLSHWSKASTPTLLGDEPLTTLADGTILLSWIPQGDTAPADGGSRGYQVTTRLKGAVSALGSEKVEYPFHVLRHPTTKKPLKAGAYEVTVAPLDANGNPGNASVPQNVTIAPPAPEQLAAAPNSSGGIDLSWTPTAVGSGYVVRYKPTADQDWLGSLETQQAGVTLADLTYGTYTWAVASKDVAGNESAAASGTFTLSPREPKPLTTDGAVLDLAVDALEWEPVAGASRYLVETSTSSVFTTVTSAETVATRFVPSANLVFSATPYYWRVRAVPEKATTGASRPVLGGWSAARAFTVTTTPTGSPSVSTPVVTGTSVTVSWAEPSAAQKGTGSGVSYDVRYHAVGAATWITKNVSDSLSYTVNGLPTNTSFELQVRTRTAIGAGPWSAVKTFKTAGVPGVVRSLATTVKSTGIRVSWSTPSSNGGSAVTGYVVSYRKSGGSSSTVNVKTTYTELTGLAGGTAYEITVKAKNAVGTGPGAMITATSIGAPDAPTSVKAVRGNASAKITWGVPKSNGGTAVTGYAVQLREYKSAWSSWSTKVSTKSSVRSASLTRLVNGRKYQVRVLAKNAVGTGKASSAVTFVPATKPGAPKKVKTISLTKKIKVSWAKPSTNGSTLKGYVIRYSTDRKNWKTLKKIGSPGTLSYTWKATKRKKAYFFQVQATSNVGSSTFSSYVLGAAK